MYTNHILFQAGLSKLICRIRLLCLTTRLGFQEAAVEIIRCIAGNNRDFSTMICAFINGCRMRNNVCKCFDTCLRETVVIPSIICVTVVYMLICIICKIYSQLIWGELLWLLIKLLRMFFSIQWLYQEVWHIMWCLIELMPHYLVKERRTF